MRVGDRGRIVAVAQTQGLSSPNRYLRPTWVVTVLRQLFVLTIGLGALGFE